MRPRWMSLSRGGRPILSVPIRTDQADSDSRGECASEEGSCPRGRSSLRMATDAHGPRLGLEHRLAAALGIAVTAAPVEASGSVWSGSLALLSDAGHVGTDAVALGLSLAALRIAGRPHTPQMSFGYHRIEVLAAFVNAVLLAAIAS